MIAVSIHRNAIEPIERVLPQNVNHLPEPQQLVQFVASAENRENLFPVPHMSNIDPITYLVFNDQDLWISPKWENNNSPCLHKTEYCFRTFLRRANLTNKAVTADDSRGEDTKFKLQYLFVWRICIMDIFKAPLNASPLKIVDQTYKRRGKKVIRKI